MTRQKKQISETKETSSKEITIAKIGLISTILVALIGVIGNVLPKLIEFQNAQMIETQLVTQEITLPTITHQLITSTPISVPTIYFQDDFLSNVHEWAEGIIQTNNATLKTEIVDGKYRKSLTFYNPPFYNYTPLVPGVSRKNFDLTIDARIVEASYLENDDASVVLSIRSSRDYSNGYLVFFSNAGWKVLVKKDGYWSYPIFDWRASDAFRLEIGRVNTFSITAKDSHFTISANSKELISFDEDTLSEAGGIGIGVGTESLAQTIVVEFDNLTIRDIDE